MGAPAGPSSPRRALRLRRPWSASRRSRSREVALSRATTPRAGWPSSSTAGRPSSIQYGRTLDMPHYWPLRQPGRPEHARPEDRALSPPPLVLVRRHGPARRRPRGSASTTRLYSGVEDRRPKTTARRSATGSATSRSPSSTRAKAAGRDRRRARLGDGRRPARPRRNAAARRP